MILHGNQYKARAGWLRLGGAEGSEDGKNDRIRGEHAEADRRENGEAENQGHDERNHDQPAFV